MSPAVDFVRTPMEWQQVIALRRAVFVDEQGGPSDEEPDALDPVSRHVAAVLEGRIVGCARLIYLGEGTLKVGRVAVRHDRRGTGIGSALMRFAHRCALAEGMRRVVLDAQVEALAFYERHGYQAEGPVFDDGGIPHRRMVLVLPDTVHPPSGPDWMRVSRIELFPHTATGIHMNHAGLSPVASPVAHAAAVAAAALLSDDTLQGYLDHAKREHRLRQVAARMASVSEDCVGFVRNTSHGLAIAAQALPKKSAGNTVCVANDYPSQIYPWMARGPVRLVEPRPDGFVHETDLEAACDSDTDVMAISWVHWTSGQELDLHRLGTFCRRRGIRFVVDVVQGFGALRLDLSSLPVDIAVAGCHKWMMAPAGIGMMFVHPETMRHLEAVNIGWNSVEHPMQWDRLHFEDLRATPRRFEEGSPSLTATAALLASLEGMESVGFDTIDANVRQLARLTRALLTDRGMKVAPGSVSSGIVPFRHPAMANDDVAAGLDRQRVRCAVRGGWVRFSPHFYLDETDIAAAVDAIPEGVLPR